jgi:hypothetical protein
MNYQKDINATMDKAVDFSARHPSLAWMVIGLLKLLWQPINLLRRVNP